MCSFAQPGFGESDRPYELGFTFAWVVWHALTQSVDEFVVGPVLTQSFDEFVVALWNYCTLDRSALLLFAFDMCDLDSTGEIGKGLLW